MHCALGHDLGPPDQSDVAQRVAEAANAASTAAQGEMRHVHEVNRALVLAGRSPELGRAPSIASTSGSDIVLGPLTRAQLENLVARERDLAVAVDARYARLQPAVTELLDPLPDHFGFPGALHDSLDGIDPSHYLRATPRPAADDLEQSLLDLSDHLYGVVVEILSAWFPDEDAVPSGRGLAIDAMNGLDQVNGLLVARGLLPPFTPPEAI